MVAFWWSVEQVFTRPLTVTVICNQSINQSLDLACAYTA